MVHRPDYSLLDVPLLLQSVFYPRQDWSPPPLEAEDHQIPVGEDISLYCRFYPVSADNPSILYFHGNGEVVFDHDWIAPLYNRIGVNLYVADYRGYGRSDGKPTFSDLVSDAHEIFDSFLKKRQQEGYTGPVFVMGRSLGSISAIELASSYPKEIGGLIIESGFASITRLLQYLSLPLDIAGLETFENDSMEMIREITVPALIIHGHEDLLIPHDEAIVTCENLGSVSKKLLSIPGAGHNDILIIGMVRYFEAIREFIRATQAAST